MDARDEGPEMSEEIKTRWDHTQKPSVFVVYRGEEVIFSGPYKTGMQIFQKHREIEKVNFFLEQKNEPDRKQHI
jgi:hypothetical protein